MHDAGFSIVDFHREDEKTVGFKILFENGYVISILFGANSESDELKIKKSTDRTEYFCKNAEIAVLNTNEELVPFTKDSSIKSFSKPEEIPQIISWVMNR